MIRPALNALKIEERNNACCEMLVIFRTRNWWERSCLCFICPWCPCIGWSRSIQTTVCIIAPAQSPQMIMMLIEARGANLHIGLEWYLKLPHYQINCSFSKCILLLYALQFDCSNNFLGLFVHRMLALFVVLYLVHPNPDWHTDE